MSSASKRVKTQSDRLKKKLYKIIWPAINKHEKGRYLDISIEHEYIKNYRDSTHNPFFQNQVFHCNNLPFLQIKIVRPPPLWKIIGGEVKRKRRKKVVGGGSKNGSKPKVQSKYKE